MVMSHVGIEPKLLKRHLGGKETENAVKVIKKKHGNRCDARCDVCRRKKGRPLFVLSRAINAVYLGVRAWLLIVLCFVEATPDRFDFRLYVQEACCVSSRLVFQAFVSLLHTHVECLHSIPYLCEWPGEPPRLRFATKQDSISGNTPSVGSNLCASLFPCVVKQVPGCWGESVRFGGRVRKSSSDIVERDHA